MNIQWYPGHMKKALREINENIKLIDIIVEVLDARIPKASRNPDIDRLAQNKERVIILNKADLADQKITKLWEDYYGKKKGYFCLSIDARNNKQTKSVSKIIADAGAKKREKDAKRGIRPRPVRALIAGIPNSGKSTFINSYMGKKTARTGDRPGVTKGKQWIRLSKDVEMLDTPGILWPKFDDEYTGIMLAICGSIRDEILKKEELCLVLIEKLTKDFPGALKSYYGIEETDPVSVLTDITKCRNFLASKGLPDISRGADAILEDFRSGRIGRISLQMPDDGEENGAEYPGA